MTDFQRDSLPWLKRLFPSSGPQAKATPFVRSDDVQLTQPFDGGGYMPRGFTPAPWFLINFNFLNPGPYLEIECWNRSVLSPNDEFRESSLRLLSLTIENNTIPSTTYFFKILVEHPDTTHTIDISELATQGNVTTGVRSRVRLTDLPPIIGPRTNLRLFQVAGPAVGTFTMNIKAYGMEAPLGSAFTI